MLLLISLVDIHKNKFPMNCGWATEVSNWPRAKQKQNVCAFAPVDIRPVKGISEQTKQINFAKDSKLNPALISFQPVHSLAVTVPFLCRIDRLLFFLGELLSLPTKPVQITQRWPAGWLRKGNLPQGGRSELNYNVRRHFQSSLRWESTPMGNPSRSSFPVQGKLLNGIRHKESQWVKGDP